MSTVKKSEILLESGTNEMEIMEFKIQDNLYGINVAKVREIMMSAPVTAVPLTHDVVEGIYKPRDTIITVINLPEYLLGPDVEKADKDIFIVTNFNRMNIAFRVSSVEGIVRLSWNDIQKPDKTINDDDEGVATGIAQINNDLITILDFEKIVAEVSPNTGIQLSDVDKLGDRDKSAANIIVVEDSILLSRMILEYLRTAGFGRITKFDNGQEAWEYLYELKHEGESAVHRNVDIVITDIEMPKMDGHRLTKLIKSDDILKNIPVIIFSSIIGDEMYIKGQELGADEQLSKPEINVLVEVIDRFMDEKSSKYYE